MTIDRRLAVLLLVGVMACHGTPVRPAVAAADAKPDAAPACMHCGATCGLEPICVCEPGTKKRPKVEFDTTCEPICIPACGSRFWPFAGRAAPIGCTTCCAEPGACRGCGRVRSCKRLKKETVDEEVPTVVHTVKHVCGRCAGHGGAGCCGSDEPRRPSAWWAGLTSWWPR